MVHGRIHRYINTVLALLLSKLGMFFKLSWVLGSTGALFSLSSSSMPLIGLYSGAIGTTVVWSFLFAMRLTFTSFSLPTLAFYIPGYCAALYLSCENAWYRTGVAALCMALFVIHPVGFQAAPYTLYWIVPIVVGIGLFRSLFARALGATFTAHAVGSVIWLYTVPMTVEYWLSLIPIVAIERITFAAGIVVTYHLVSFLASYVVRCTRSIPFSYFPSR